MSGRWDGLDWVADEPLTKPCECRSATMRDNEVHWRCDKCGYVAPGMNLREHDRTLGVGDIVTLPCRWAGLHNPGFNHCGSCNEGFVTCRIDGIEVKYPPFARRAWRQYRYAVTLLDGEADDD